MERHIESSARFDQFANLADLITSGLLAGGVIVGTVACATLLSKLMTDNDNPAETPAAQTTTPVARNSQIVQRFMSEVSTPILSSIVTSWGLTL
jgi:hypothetical protein